MGGGLLLCVVLVSAGEDRGGVGGACFPVVLVALGEEGAGLGGLGGGLCSSSVTLVFWLSESSRNEGNLSACFLSIPPTDCVVS